MFTASGREKCSRSYCKEKKMLGFPINLCTALRKMKKEQPQMPSTTRTYKRKERASADFKNKPLKQLYRSMCVSSHPYLSIVRISVKPGRKLCDITGLPAPYTCPRTSLRYYNLSVFRYLRSLSSEHSESYYAIKMYGNSLGNLKK